MLSRMAKRFSCTSGDRYPHDHGVGTPKRKTCAYCHGRLAVVTGSWGVFPWVQSGRYPVQDALSTYERESVALGYVNGVNTADPSRNLVVRWIPS
jgi:hypothetical protein